MLPSEGTQWIDVSVLCEQRGASEMCSSSAELLLVVESLFK